MPRQADLAAGIASGEQAAELGVAMLAEPLMRGDQQPPRPPQRITLAAAVSQGVVLGSAAHLVDAVVRQADHMERIRDLSDPLQRDIEGPPVRPRAVQHAPGDAVAPPRGLIQSNSQLIGASASRPAAMSSSWPPVTSRSRCTTGGSARRPGARTGSHQDQALPRRPHARRQRPATPSPRRAPPGSPCASHTPTRQPHETPGARRGPPRSSPIVPPAP